MKKILLFLTLLFSFLIPISGTVYAAANNLNIWSIGSSRTTGNEKLENFRDGGQFINVSTSGERGILNTLIKFAKDLKNLFFAMATIFFLIITLRLILSSNTEEEIENFKKWIIWITIGIIVMQMAFAFTKILFDRSVGEALALSLVENLIQPLIALLETLASFFFIAIAIYAFYRMVTANGEEEAISKAKNTIIYAIIGFMIVRFARAIVEAFYGKINCESFSFLGISIESWNCNVEANFDSGIQIIINVINWLNSFVALVVVIMIMYAGAQILLSAGDEEKLKKGKQIIIYIAIGIFILVANYLILTFFLIPESTI
jgi:Type IV secretion system pilin